MFCTLIQKKKSLVIYVCTIYKKIFLSDKEIECRVSRPPTKIGDLLFHGKNDNNEAVSCLRAKSFFFKLLRYYMKRATHNSFR